MATSLILDQYARPIKYGMGGSRLQRAAQWSMKRQQVFGLSGDHSGIFPAYDRDKMSQIGRWQFANNPLIHTALIESSGHAALGIGRVFFGEDKEKWGVAAQELLEKWDRSADVRGGPFTMPALARAFVLATQIDGDMFAAMVRDEDGMPKLQSFRAHRVGGTDEKASVFDGVKVNGYGKPIAYRIIKDGNKFEDMPAGAFIPLMLPNYADQWRGVSSLAAAAIACMDLAESESAELIAQKRAAMMAFVEASETGDADDDTRELMQGGTTADGKPLVTEIFDEGMTMHVKAGSGASLTPVISDRPTANQAAFAERITRQIMSSLGWPFEFTCDPNKAGGASMRVVMEKVNSTIEYLRNNLVFPLYYAFDTFRIACAIEDGILPANKDWYKWRHVGPPPLTSDKKYDSDVRIQELNNCLTTMQAVCAESGQNWQEVIKQRVIEEKLLQAECEKAGVNPSRIKLLTPLELNPSKVAGQQATPAQQQPDSQPQKQ